MINKEERKVGVYSIRMLGYSQIFIKRQAASLKSWSPVILASVLENEIEIEGAPYYENRSAGLVGTLRDLGLWFLGVSSVFTEAVRKEKVSLIHAHFGISGYALIPFVRKKKLPLVVTFHGRDAALLAKRVLEGPRGKLIPDRILERRYKQLFERADSIIAVSEHVKKLLLGAGAPESKVVRHYIGVPFDDSFLPQPPEHGKILFVGRLVAKKGVFDLLHAVDTLQKLAPDCLLTIIGGGELEDSARALATELNINIRWLGVLTAEQTKVEMANSQLLVVPSFTPPDGDMEGLPTVIPEAMSLGVPVIGTNHAGIPEIIEDGQNGFLVEERNVAGLTDRMFQVLSSQELRERLSQGASRTVRRSFDLETQTEKLEEIYQDAVVRFQHK